MNSCSDTVALIFRFFAPFPGVLLPLHRVCGLHHAALLHERGHFCQRHHLLVTHCHTQHLSGL